MKPEPQASNDAFAPSRLRIDLRSGALVRHANGAFRITEVLDFDSVVATQVETGRTQVLRIGELLSIESIPAVASDVDIDAIAEEDWRVANDRYSKIKPLLESGDQSRKAVEARAAEVGVDAATLYRWLSRYRSMDAISALIPFKRGWKTGNYRINEHAERVIQDVIKDYYLKPERPTVQKAVREVHSRCVDKHIERPSATAIRARIARIPEHVRLMRRGQAEKARNKFHPVPGKFPGADYPLSVVQIDHTRVDIILVDDVHRKPIDRPWVTVAIDVFSRMTVGYHLSFDAPSTTSVAMCISHAMLPKEEWLLLHGVEGTWPVWGRPHKVHVDNGPDFRSQSLKQSCDMHGVDLEFRPVKQPRYGGHIERLQGTLLKEIHDIPGTTFSSVAERGEYDSEKNAIMTKDEFERQLIKLICNEYHRRKHSALGMPPLRMWELGIFGGAGMQGVGLPHGSLAAPLLPARSAAPRRPSPPRQRPPSPPRAPASPRPSLPPGSAPSRSRSRRASNARPAPTRPSPAVGSPPRPRFKSPSAKAAEVPPTANAKPRWALPCRYGAWAPARLPAMQHKPNSTGPWPPSRPPACAWLGKSAKLRGS
jgi:putative transposase